MGSRGSGGVATTGFSRSDTKVLKAALGVANEHGVARIADIRDRLPGMDRGAVNKALTSLDRSPDIHVQSIEGPHLRTPRDNAAAFHLGGEPQHIVRFSSRHPRPPAS